MRYLNTYKRILCIGLMFVIIFNTLMIGIASNSIANNASPKVNVYAFENTIIDDILINNGDWNVKDLFYIIETRDVDEYTVASIIEDILINNIFWRVQDGDGFRDENSVYYESMFNSVSYKNKTLIIDYNKAGYNCLNAGTAAAIIYGNEINRTVFSCSLVDVIDERYNGESGGEADHYGFNKINRVKKYDTFINERAVTLNSNTTYNERLSTAYQEYYKILESMINTYGLVDEYEDMDFYDERRTGICKAELIDLDNSGIPALMVIFKTPGAFNYELKYFIYGFTNKVVLYFKDREYFHTGGGQIINILTSRDKKYIVRSNDVREYLDETYYCIENGKCVVVLDRFGVKNRYNDWMEQDYITCEVNGKDATYNEFYDCVDKLNLDVDDDYIWHDIMANYDKSEVEHTLKEILDRISEIGQINSVKDNTKSESLKFTIGWGEEAIKKAKEYDIIPDTLNDANIDYTLPINRIEFAGIAARIYENLSETTVANVPIKTFSDISSEDVMKVYNTGIMVGYTDKEFAPYINLNREQCATAFTRAIKKSLDYTWTLNSDSKYKLLYTKSAIFADDNYISSWAKEGVYFMVANDIIKGIGNNMFAPVNRNSSEEESGYATATREQALAIAVRIIDNKNLLKKTSLIFINEERLYYEYLIKKIEYLNSLYGDGGFEIFDESIVDVDGDGISELFYEISGGEGLYGGVCTIENGVVVELFNDGDLMSAGDGSAQAGVAYSKELLKNVIFKSITGEVGNLYEHMGGVYYQGYTFYNLDEYKLSKIVETGFRYNCNCTSGISGNRDDTKSYTINGNAVDVNAYRKVISNFSEPVGNQYKSLGVYNGSGSYDYFHYMDWT